MGEKDKHIYGIDCVFVALFDMFTELSLAVFREYTKKGNRREHKTWEEYIRIVRHWFWRGPSAIYLVCSWCELWIGVEMYNSGCLGCSCYLIQRQFFNSTPSTTSVRIWFGQWVLIICTILSKSARNYRLIFVSPLIVVLAECGFGRQQAFMRECVITIAQFYSSIPFARKANLIRSIQFNYEADQKEKKNISDKVCAGIFFPNSNTSNTCVLTT